MSAAPAVHTSTFLTDDDPGLEFDPSQPECDEVVEHQANDEQCWHTETRERAEAADAQSRSRLNDPKKARAIYRDKADAQPKLTPGRFRVLSYQLRKADPDLSNSFPSRTAAAQALGISPATYDRHLTALKDQGWVRVHEFQNSTTGRQSSSGIQFCIPAGVLPLGEPWVGPARWNKHVGADAKQPRQKRQSRLSKNEGAVYQKTTEPFITR